MMILRIGNDFVYSLIRLFVDSFNEPTSQRANELTKSGFTLIELMISVVILGFGLTFVIQSYLSALKGLEITQNYIAAATWARDKLTEVELSAYENKGLVPGLGAESGDIKLGTRKFTWTTQINEIVEPDYLAEEAVEVCLKMNWQERAVSKGLNLAMYLPRKKE